MDDFYKSPFLSMIQKIKSIKKHHVAYALSAVVLPVSLGSIFNSAQLITAGYNDLIASSVAQQSVALQASRSTSIINTNTTTYPTFTSKQYTYTAGNSMADLSNPIVGYYTSKPPAVACTNTKPDNSDNCVPKYRYYGMLAPYQFYPSQTINPNANWMPSLGGKSLAFWGSAGVNYPNCFMINGTTTSDPLLAPELGTAISKTRISFTPGYSFRWAPAAPTTAGCPAGKSGGPSYAIFTSGSVNAGLGLFTLSGLGFHNELYKGYTAAGQDGLGTNAYIAGTYFNFYQNPNMSSPLRLFSGNSTDNNVKRFLLESTQSAYNVSTYSPSGDKTHIAQVQQLVPLGVGNKTCISQRITNPSLICQVLIHQQSYVSRREYKNGVLVLAQNDPWNQNATYNYDPVQGSLPYLMGPLKTNGTATTINYHGRTYSLWTSLGDATVFQNNTTPTTGADGLAVPAFENLTFRTQMTFNQYLTFLRMIAADSYYKESGKQLYPEDISDSYMASKFGTAWNDPNEYVVMKLGFAQEGVNPIQETERVAMGGNIKYLNLQALP